MDPVILNVLVGVIGFASGYGVCLWSGLRALDVVTYSGGDDDPEGPDA